MSAPIKRRSFGPRAIKVAHFSHFLPSRIGSEPPFDLMEQIDRQWPELSSSDFVGAVALAESLALRPER